VNGSGPDRRRRLAVAAAALAAVDPAANLRQIVRLEDDDLVVTPPGDEARRFDLSGRRVIIVGAGKASMGMAAVLDELLGGRIDRGAVVVKRGQAVPLARIEVLEASHPVPDASSLAGGERLLEIAATAAPGDLLIALVTGGSSALAVAPADGLSLSDKIAVNRLLLACGADIVAVNQVRKHLSRLKGGRLARSAGCEVLNFTVSDVVGDPLDAVTDLTVPDTSTFADAQAVCDRWGLWPHLPTRAAAHLRRADPAQESCHSLSAVTSFVVADARMMCEAAAREAEELGYRAAVLRLDLEGESADAGRWFAGRLGQAGPATAVVAGGEATTVLRSGTGLSGGGGPSQDGALAGAVVLGHRALGAPPACILCLDSDGADGPGHAAGGLVDDLSAAALAAARMDPPAAIDAHAAGTALEAAGDRVFTGPTGTNVNDLKIGLTGR
jgi:glycerate 2-kinase